MADTGVVGLSTLHLNLQMHSDQHRRQPGPLGGTPRRDITLILIDVYIHIYIYIP